MEKMYALEECFIVRADLLQEATDIQRLGPFGPAAERI